MEQYTLNKYFSLKRQSDDIRKKRDFALVRKGYDDLKLGEQYSDGDHEQARVVVDAVRPYIKEGFKVLDAGCGGGKVLNQLSQMKIKDVQLVGVDISPAGVMRSDKIAPSFVSSLEDMNIPHKDFNVVICNNTIEHLIDIDKALSNFYNILVEDGILYIQTDNSIWQILSCIRNVFVPAGRRYERSSQPINGDFIYCQLKRLLKKHGFEVLKYAGNGSLPIAGRLFSRFFNTSTNPIYKHFTAAIVVIARKIKTV